MNEEQRFRQHPAPLDTEDQLAEERRVYGRNMLPGERPGADSGAFGAAIFALACLILFAIWAPAHWWLHWI